MKLDYIEDFLVANAPAVADRIWRRGLWHGFYLGSVFGFSMAFVLVWTVRLLT